MKRIIYFLHFHYCMWSIQKFIMFFPFQLLPGQSLPSPNRLKNKILIKNKRLHPEVEKKELELFRRGELAIEDPEEERDDPKGTIGATASPIAAAIAGSAAAATTSEGGAPGGAATTSEVGAPGGATSAGGPEGAAGATSTTTIPTSTTYQGSTLNVHPYLSSMVNYTTPQKFQGFQVQIASIL